MIKVLFGFTSVRGTDQFSLPQKLGYLNVSIPASSWVLIREEQTNKFSVDSTEIFEPHPHISQGTVRIRPNADCRAILAVEV